MPIQIHGGSVTINKPMSVGFITTPVTPPTPQAVGLDWNGITSSKQHLKKLKFGNASFIEQKTEDMAATLE